MSSRLAISRELLFLAIFSAAAICGCNKSAKPIAAASTQIVELSGNYKELADVKIPAGLMSYHGVRLGDPEAAASALPGSQKVDAAIVDNESLHAVFQISNGKIVEIALYDPSLATELNIYRQEDVYYEFGKADDLHPPPAADGSSAHSAGIVYEYFARRLRVMCSPNNGSGTPSVNVTVILYQ